MLSKTDTRGENSKGKLETGNSEVKKISKHYKKQTEKLTHNIGNKKLMTETTEELMVE